MFMFCIKKQQQKFIYMFIFLAFVVGCSSIPLIDKTTEKPITDMQSIAGTWTGSGQWCPPGSLPLVFFPTVYFQEDGSSLLQISSNYEEYGPCYYKGQLHNGRLWTTNGEYALYERDGRRVLVYRSYEGNTEARLDPLDSTNVLPAKTSYCQECSLILGNRY